MWSLNHTQIGVLYWCNSHYFSDEHPDLHVGVPSRLSSHLGQGIYHLHKNLVGMKKSLYCCQIPVSIGGFRGGGEAFFLLFSKYFTILLWKLSCKCSLILSSKMLTLFNFASRIGSQCCMLHALKSEVFIRGGGGWGTWPPLSEFSGSASGKRCRMSIVWQNWLYFGWVLMYGDSLS